MHGDMKKQELRPHLSVDAAPPHQNHLGPRSSGLHFSPLQAAAPSPHLPSSHRRFLKPRRRLLLLCATDRTKAARAQPWCLSPRRTNSYINHTARAHRRNPKHHCAPSQTRSQLLLSPSPPTSLLKRKMKKRKTWAARKRWLRKWKEKEMG